MQVVGTAQMGTYAGPGLSGDQREISVASVLGGRGGGAGKQVEERISSHPSHAKSLCLETRGETQMHTSTRQVT